MWQRGVTATGANFTGSFLTIEVLSILNQAFASFGGGKSSVQLGLKYPAEDVVVAFLHNLWWKTTH